MFCWVLLCETWARWVNTERCHFQQCTAIMRRITTQKSKDQSYITSWIKCACVPLSLRVQLRQRGFDGCSSWRAGAGLVLVDWRKLWRWRVQLEEANRQHGDWVTVTAVTQVQPSEPRNTSRKGFSSSRPSPSLFGALSIFPIGAPLIPMCQ